jgi:PIN domain nuclease of toxin-antitoxin system
LRFLLDTHALLWWLNDDRQLPAKARKLIALGSNAVVVSAASAWEIATKVRLGKLDIAAELAADFSNVLAQEGFESLPISVDHALRAGLLPGPHKDPFDRMLIAQAQAEGVPILSSDAVFDEYGVRRLW